MGLPIGFARNTVPGTHGTASATVRLVIGHTGRLVRVCTSVTPLIVPDQTLTDSSKCLDVPLLKGWIQSRTPRAHHHRPEKLAYQNSCRRRHE